MEQIFRLILLNLLFEFPLVNFLQLRYIVLAWGCRKSFIVHYAYTEESDLDVSRRTKRNKK